ncbi:MULTISPECIES: TetR/AcrR family transcriptional regulator [Paraburkholderia]|jgi:AcrR family transcriptional regulator|uniref:TetR family transcriptional regulator n=1 Tax=Paraburkholderia largidicola TaxID=3014751 RepID=A0A7I8BHV8_9BURK|nr:MULTISPECIES: TetR/AcrR family transcriptional regulator [Paraburkholderia]BEU21320.1 TetR/AcrR family transcriptional regulator [Paraburkholderia sp. 22B1P]GJH37837.1 TetR family transcriptional regulator [Paraburkholderia hospita]CAG9251693.1 Transcriptional regulator, TetR family [Paraburkholderia caribensis]BCF88284.1 TetR family transcriptional regulator [Paraburkholderia sp. PGU16]GJH02485.1 TetR family transcriptional regulator [Paraburkholderia terrae]
MKRKRLTREQSKDQTRLRLLDAAQAIFMKKGFVAASVEDIAEAAGYTRGAFYSNFRSKPELFLELLRRDHESMQADLQNIFEENATREDMEASVLRYYSRMPSENKCFLLWVEAKLLAARDVRFRVRFNAFMHEKLEQLTAYITEFSVRVGTPLPLPAETLALGLMGLCDGMQFFFTVDPQRFSGERAEEVLGNFFARVVFGRTME